MHKTPSTNDDPTASDTPTELRGAQKRIRDAYLNHESGLFVLNCTAGAGKSVTATDVTAEDLLRRYENGDPTPEQHICVVSFTRDDAAEFVPAVIDRLRELVTYDLTPAAEAVSEDEVEDLVDRVRRAPLFGTIDSVVHRIFREFAADVGFEEEPDIGNEAQLTHLHTECYEELAADPAYAEPIDVVEAAYPPGEYDAGPQELLAQALQHCRARQLTTAAFADELRETIEVVYDEGETTSFDEIATALARCVGDEAADEACQSLDESARDDLVTADQQLHTAWGETIDAFESLLEGYREAYQRLTRELGVISHTDCSFLVAEFLAGTFDMDGAADTKRERVLARYRGRIESLIIDEAQDISTLQHAVLAQLATEESRVLAAGDLRQAIYVWRDAHPKIFERAIEAGQYLGIDWTTHVTETAATTYRCTPDVAAAINAIAEPALTDPTCGNLGDLDVVYPRLDAARDTTDGPSLHVAAFDTGATPGSIPYVAPDSGIGEANILATYIASGLADGTFDHTDSGPETGDETATSPDVTVLFRWRTHMERYRQAFEAEGLTVAEASTYLFSCPAVSAAIDVAEWLGDPVDIERTQALVRDSALGLASLEATFETHDWQLDAVRDAATDELTDEQEDVLTRLQRLREQRPMLRGQSAVGSLADIIDCLALRADPNQIAPTEAPAQRIANLDKLLALVGQWTTESQRTLGDLTDILVQYRDEPHRGPTQPVHSDEHDVVFKTIHQMKGDESDIVALGDIGYPLRKHGPVSQRLLTAGSMAGLAPPTHATAEVEALSVYSRGLYDPDRDDTQFVSTGYPRDVGLRWASEHWSDDVESGDTTPPELVGHDHLQRAARLRRAEAYRLLYVAVSRTRNHLVVPLPREIHGSERPRNRWLESIRNSLGFDGTPRAGTYTLNVEAADGSARTIDVAVNDVDALSTRPPLGDTNIPTPVAAETPPDGDALPSLVPRFLSPSKLAPLSDDLEATLLEHLQGQPLHTDTETVDDDLPLTLDAFDTEDVGAIVHSVLAACVQRDVCAEDLRTPSDAVEQLIDDELQAHGPPANATERAGLIDFITDWILPDIVGSQLWTQLQQADSVFIEKPLRGHIERDDLEIELDGQADFVLKDPDGSWTITEIKTTLTPMTTDTRRRYQLQVAAYAWLLARETDVTDPGSITATIETFGAATDRYDVSFSSIGLQQRLDTLLGEGE